MILTGNKAIEFVESLEGRELTNIERRVVLEEGCSTDVYRDTKGIPTFGVGQTGEFLTKPFSECIQHFFGMCRAWFPRFDSYPEYLQEEFIQSAYRGDLGGSPRTRGLINKGYYQQAAHEFLDHREYLDPETPIGIKRRIKSVSDALVRYSEELHGA